MDDNEGTADEVADTVVEPGVYELPEELIVVILVILLVVVAVCVCV